MTICGYQTILMLTSIVDLQTLYESISMNLKEELSSSSIFIFNYSPSLVLLSSSAQSSSSACGWVSFNFNSPHPPPPTHPRASCDIVGNEQKLLSNISRSTLVEDNLCGRRPQLKMTSVEDNLRRRQPEWKTTSVEDNVNGSVGAKWLFRLWRPLIWHNNWNSWGTLLIYLLEYCTHRFDSFGFGFFFSLKI